MAGRVMLGQGVVVVCGECLVSPVQGAERGLDGAKVLCTELAQRTERLVDSVKRGLVIANLEM